MAMAEASSSRTGPSRPPAPNVGHRVSTPEENLRNITKCHDEGYLYIHQGLECDEKGHGEQAYTLYTKGLRRLDKVLCVQATGPQCQGPEWDKARELLTKMTRTKETVTSRVQELLRSDPHAARSFDDPPPSYEIATTPVSTDADMMLAESLAHDQYPANSRVAQQIANAREVHRIDDGVQIFYITPEGYVSAPSYPSSLSIYQFSQEYLHAINADQNTAPAFLKVDDWTTPLIPGGSPILHADYGAYVFPDINARDPGSSVGLLLPDTMSARQKQEFEMILNTMTDAMLLDESQLMRQQHVRPEPQESAEEEREQVRVPPPRPRPPLAPHEAPEPEPKDTSTKISEGIVSGAEWLSEKVGVLANKGGKWVGKGGDKLRNRMDPNERPSTVDPRLQTGMEYTHKVVDKVFKGSVFVVDKLGQGTMALGRYVAPHIRRGSEQILPQSFTKKDGEGKSKTDAVFEVAAGSLRGFGTVYMGLENAAGVLARSIGKETVSTVTHKYGDEAGKLANNAVHSTVYTLGTANNIRNLGIKAIAKRAAKDAGKAVVEDMAKEAAAKATIQNGEAGQSEKPMSNTRTQNDGKAHATADVQPPPYYPVDPSAPQCPTKWTCPACTFINNGHMDYCEMCKSPRVVDLT